MCSGEPSCPFLEMSALVGAVRIARFTRPVVGCGGRPHPQLQELHPEWGSGLNHQWLFILLHSGYLSHLLEKEALLKLLGFLGVISNNISPHVYLDLYLAFYFS